MEKEILNIQKDVSGMTEKLNHLSKTMDKVEIAMEKIALIIAEQNSNKEKIKKLEGEIAENKEKIRKLEDWRLTMMAGAGVVGSIVGFLLNKIF